MAITLAQQTNAQSASTSSLGVTWAGNTTNGNLILVVIGGTWPNQNSVVQRTTVTDSQGNIYNRIVNRIISGSPSIDVWYAKNITGGTTPTVTVANPVVGTSILASIHEFSGLDTVQPLDLFTSATINSTSPVGNLWSVGPMMQTRADNELVFVATNTSSTGLTWTAGTNYGNTQQQSLASNGVQGTEFRILSARTTEKPTFSLNGSTSGPMVAITFADTTMPLDQFYQQQNDYQFIKAGDGMWVSEKIR